MGPIIQCLPFLFMIVLSATTSNCNGTSQSHFLKPLNNVTTHISTRPNLSGPTTHHSASPTMLVKSSQIQSHSVASLKGMTTTVSIHPRNSITSHPSASPINSVKGSQTQSHSVTSLKGTTTTVSIHPRTSTTTHPPTSPTTSVKSSKTQSRSVTSLKGMTTTVSTHSKTSTTTTQHSPSSVTPDLQATAGFTLPVAAAWLYMSDSTDYKNIPKWWNTMDFTKVDVLYVAPLGVQNDSTFGLYSSEETGPIETRFRWVIQAARTQNPHIKIIASQFWGGNPGHFTIWGYDYLALKNSSAISKYAASVAGFMQAWKSFHGGVDGYDVDFEATNVTPKAPEILKEIHQKLSALDRHYYITVSPSVVAYLQEAKPYIDYVNMQNYAGGYYLTPQVFTKAGFSSKQLLYGICPEAGCHTHNITDVVKQYKNNHLAGVHLWRLDSTNHPHEQDWQDQIYKALHDT